MGIPELILDDRVRQTIDALSTGISRDELARLQGYRDRQAIDQYMRRHGYVWDVAFQNYRPKGEQKGRVAPSVRTVDVIAQFKKPGADPREVAKRVGFPDHRKMAEYMQARGYTWDSSKLNYVPAYGEEEETMMSENMEEQVGNQQYPPIDYRLLAQFAQMTSGVGNPLMIDQGTSQIPRYNLPGIRTMKSFQISSTLGQIVAEYCRDKTISQREFVEVALVEALRRYGYSNQIDALMTN